MLTTLFSHLQTSENHFYSIRPTLFSTKELQNPPWLMSPYPRRPRVKLLFLLGTFLRGKASFTLDLSARMAVGLPFVAPCCIESGDDLDPDLVRGLAFGRAAGVGDGGRLTGLLFLSFSLLSCACHAL
ncbi:hypothetical protein F5X96DRAFT_613021 [Biscogniauxia mediterranea]|nr:hypothetical protein F5X96DRAFT_613021 [Biscogniauxia mediterranea]